MTPSPLPGSVFPRRLPSLEPRGLKASADADFARWLADSAQAARGRAITIAPAPRGARWLDRFVTALAVVATSSV